MYVGLAKRSLRAFRRDERGQVAIIFGLALVPILVAAGAALDYSRATGARALLQGAMDAAVLAGAKDGSSSWQNTATATFNANPSASYIVVAAPSFSEDTTSSTYTGSVSASVPTSLLKMAGFNSITVSVTSVVNGGSGSADSSCILTLDNGSSRSHVGMTFNGAPNVNLDHCGIRSNSSITCNGHSTGALASMASGSAGGCTNPKSDVPPVPDIYASLASNITRKCGMSIPGFTWLVGIIPSGGAVFKSTVGSYTQYNICGDLTLSGSGYLTGSAPTTDTVIIVENGSLNIANSSSITALRTTIILTGDNSVPSAITFPNGKGQASTLSLSASTSSNNPWQGVSLYQDPALTNGVDDSWGPGATFNNDGIVYLPKANITMSGSGGSGLSNCSKLVANTFTTNGSVNLNYSQAGCSGFAMKQYSGQTVYLSQ